MGVRIKSKAIQRGFHFDQVGWRDNMQVRCSRCGWICNLDRDLRSHPGGWESWGTRMEEQSTTPLVDVQTPLVGQVMYSSSMGPTDILYNGADAFSFGPNSLVYHNSASTYAYGSILLAYNGNMYLYATSVNSANISDDSTPLNTVKDNSGIIVTDDNASSATKAWFIWNNVWSYITKDPRIGGETENIYDAVVGAGCPQCGSLLYNNPARGTKG